MSNYGSQSGKKPSLVDYSKVADRPERVVRMPTAAHTAPIPRGPHSPAPATAAPPASAQMDAVTRLLTGRQERTIAEKLADANRPTWEQYKRENHDKLNLDGIDHQQMQEYRQQLDADRDPRMAGKKKKQRKRREASTSDASSSESNKKRRHKRHRKTKRQHNHEGSENESDASLESNESKEKRRKKKHRKTKRRHNHQESENESDSSLESNESKEKRRKKKHRKTKRRHHEESENESNASLESNGSKRKRKKKHRTKKRRHEASEHKAGDTKSESDGEHYRLSNFFANDE